MIERVTTIGHCVPAPSYAERAAARIILRRLERWPAGALNFELPDGRIVELGDAGREPAIRVVIRSWRFFTRALVAGDIGVGEAYVDGDWDCSDLVGLCRRFVENQEVMDGRSPWSLPMRVAHTVRRVLQANTKRGSRRNIRRHYDLSNDLFRLFLDESMTYSAGMFPHPGVTLEEAQRTKLRAVGNGLGLQPKQHVLEIGSGWGSFAIYAAKEHGCQVTSLTLSEHQLRLARERIAAAGLSDRIRVLLCDYRDVTGSFDHIASIEMFEAVGRHYYDAFFAACERLLRPAGRVFLQTIAIPDQRFDAYARDYDWTRKYIFPGSLLASLHEITASLKRVTTLRIESLRDIGLDYAETLRHWRERLLRRGQEVRKLGFDERFVRMWTFYLASCEASFRCRYINDLQLILSRPMPFARALERSAAAPTA